MAGVPRCPECGKPVPFYLNRWRFGRSFQCRGCGTWLVLPVVASSIAASLYVALCLMLLLAAWRGQVGALAVLLAGFGTLVSWGFVAPARAPPP